MYSTAAEILAVHPKLSPAAAERLSIRSEDVTTGDIYALKDEAAAAGDREQVTLCWAALDGDDYAFGECAAVIRDARVRGRS